MKVAVVTLHRVWNYGSVLQTFATQELIRDLGHEVDIVDYVTEARALKNIFFSCPESLKRSVVKQVFFVMSRFPANVLKHISFSRFAKENYNLTKRRYHTVTDLQVNPPDADVYMVGSDQVWNSKYNKMIDRGFFLDFGDESIKRFSLASSFGVDELERDEISTIKRLLSKFHGISVREKSALQIIRDMGLDARWILDPTLILTKERWEQYLKGKKRKEKYLLLFLLYNEDNGATKYARQIADQKGLKVIQLYWKPFRRQGVDSIAIYKSPFEFLRYVRDAEYIVTNSFHGTAFAINFNKQFLTVARREFNSRLESILALCDLGSRYVETDFNLSLALETINYDSVNERVQKERDNSLKYLEEMLR